MADEKSSQRIGLFGGTFDPIHIGHLLIAEAAREHLGLDQVRFLPAAQSPLKSDQPTADAKQRLEMVRLAIGGHPHFEVDDRELKRGGTSYTVSTLQEFRSELPEAEFVFLMGADSLADFDRWRSPHEICELAFVAVLARGGQAAPDMEILKKHLPTAQQHRLSDHLVPVAQVEISSSDLRARVQQSRSVRYQLHPTTAAYIDANQLYR